MTTAAELLAASRPDSISAALPLPRRQRYTASPVDWRDEVLYFLLVDRFSDGNESARPLLQRAMAASTRGSGWSWERWFESGAKRFQGGTIRGVTSKLDYLANLGVTAIWLSPVFKQRTHLDTYHGYGVQDFLDIDPRFGTREDLVELVAKAHEKGIRVILDIIFNHSGRNWDYDPAAPGGPHQPFYTGARHAFGSWLDASGQATDDIASRDDGVWPAELQAEEAYTRAGKANLGESDFTNPLAEHKRGDFEDLRDFDLDAQGVITHLAWCYKYWIALTDCDGFRIDTVKHVSRDHARNFCGTIKEFAANLGKERFLLIGEIAGGDDVARYYLDALDRNLDAALDIGGMRETLVGVAQGLVPPREYFRNFDPNDVHVPLGSHRNLGGRHVSIVNDHDHVFGAKLRIAANAPNLIQPAAAVGLQLFTLGIPCIYYGTEQAFAGPEAAERQWLPNWGGHDVYLREAMFGPEHPRASGSAGLQSADAALPGFGPFGTAGRHAFDPGHEVYRRIAAMARLRRDFPVLRHGRQYQRETSFLGSPFLFHGGGEILAWSRILDDEEAVVVVNTHGVERRSANVLVDASLNPVGSAFRGVFGNGATLPVNRNGGGIHYIEVRSVGPSEVMVLTNRL